MLDTKRVLFTVILVFSVSLSGCGKKGAPEPPEATAPSPVKYLTLEGTIDAVILSWLAPETDAGGDELIDLVGFVVKKNLYQKDRRPDFDDIAEIQVVEPEEDEVEEVDDKEVPEVVQYRYRDEEVEPGMQYEYVVVPVNEAGVEGVAEVILRVTFVGESSVFESYQP